MPPRCRPNRWSRWLVVLFCIWIAGGCSEPSHGSSSADRDALSVGDSSGLDGQRPAAEPQLRDFGSDFSFTDASADAMSQEPCEWAPVTPTLVGPPESPMNEKTGVSLMELDPWHRARDALLAHDQVHFVGTYLRSSQEFVIVGGPPSSRTEVRFVAEWSEDSGLGYTVTHGDLADIFPNRTAQVFGTLESLFDAFSNPMNSQIPERGYVIDDPRVGYLAPELQSYPLVLERLATLFHSVDGPDVVYGRFPWANGGTGTHGGLSLLQSQASLVLSGPGLKRGVVLDRPASLVDISPTALALLGSETTSGQGIRGRYSDGLYLTRQDGRVLYEAFDERSCERAKRVVIILFDGLQAGELNHQTLIENPDVEVPHLRSLVEAGVVYRHGAIAGFPSYSAPGHTTVGTGAWPGHHGMIANSFYGRRERDVITPFDLLSNLPRFIQDPDAAQAMYDRLVTGPVENLAQAAHRGLGRYDPNTGEGAFVAIINEITFPDADFSTLSFFDEGAQKGLVEYRIADNLAMTQIDRLLVGDAFPVPTILQLSFLATDAAGESDGPHSALLREVLVEMDNRVGHIMDAYAARDALHDTVFILTSDHGMELQDPQRRVSPASVLRSAGVKTDFVQAGLIYLRTLDIAVDLNPEDRTVTVSVQQLSDDTPLADALVRSPELMQTARTDEFGRVRFEIPLGVSGQITLFAEHASFNDGQIHFTAPAGDMPP